MVSEYANKSIEQECVRCIVKWIYFKIWLLRPILQNLFREIMGNFSKIPSQWVIFFRDWDSGILRKKSSIKVVFPRTFADLNNYFAMMNTVLKLYSRRWKTQIRLPGDLMFPSFVYGKGFIWHIIFMRYWLNPLTTNPTK